MKLDEYTACDGLDLAELVAARQVAPHELAELSAAAAAAVNPTLGAVVELHEDRLGAEWAGDLGARFAGVPFMLKDIGCTERGRRCEAGSRLMAGWRAPDDTELMRRFGAAGLVNLGRTATSEFACAATVETAANGVTRNPWNVAYSTAGSSGGSAAAVAAGIMPIAHGSDGGGSIRMPASCCGVVGLKPSRGRVSPAPAAPPPGDLSVEFVLTRSVRDAAALLDAVAGAAPGDLYVIAPYQADGPRRRPLRIAFTADHLWGLETDPQVRHAAEQAAALCERLGHSVEVARPHFAPEPYISATLDVWHVNTAAAVQWAASVTGRTAGPETLEGQTWAWAERGAQLSALELSAALDLLAAASREVAGLFERYDVFLSPTLPTLPLELGHYDPFEPVHADWYYRSPVGNLESTTSLFNCTGQPAISLPLYQSDEGLPIGIHLAARFAGESVLLDLAAQLEEALPWADRRPPVHAASA